MRAYIKFRRFCQICLGLPQRGHGQASGGADSFSFLIPFWFSSMRGNPRHFFSKTGERVRKALRSKTSAQFARPDIAIKSTV